MDKKEILQKYFGYREFRPGQVEMIDGVLGRRDVFGIMPTGGGKSLCYQVPALMLPGITLVVSPLISLMRDQVLSLKAAGVAAAYINSTLNAAQMNAVYRNLLAGKYKLVYIAPERLDHPGFAEVISQLQVSFVAVDEAHCISQWGQDFRPSYLRIVHFVRSLPERPVLGAFTATATKQVREDVERILELRDPVRAVTGFDRPNLSFAVSRPRRKAPELMRLMKSRKGKSGIIYCATRKTVESVCEALQQAGYEATRYHAGLGERERTANQEDFIHDRKTVMVATNAFGMGIDKSNVSYVIHYNMPKSIEAYYQEAGRAGRDGAAAECILLYSGADVTTAKFLIDTSTDNEQMDPAQREIVRQQDLQRLDAMVSYCKTKSCLRGYILDYFGQEHTDTCGNCSNCATEYETVDITLQAQMILSCVKRICDRLGYSVGAGTVIKTLLGSKDKRLLGLGLDQLPTYGLLKTVDKTKLRGMVEWLEEQGYLQTDPRHQALRLTAQASPVLYHEQPVQMPVPKKKQSAAPSAGALSADALSLYEALRQLRAEVAKESAVPAYVVFTNATLQDMATKKPTNMSQFKNVSGVGALKASWYGDRFIEKIREYLALEES